MTAPVDISLAPVGARLGYWPMIQIVSFASYLRPQFGPDAPGTVYDNVSLTAAAQRYLLAKKTGQFPIGVPFPYRTSPLSDSVPAHYPNISNGDFTGGIFIGQNLQKAVFDDALLTDANFSGANLQDANFTNSNVSGANFNQANLSGANLSGVQGLTSTQVQGANFDKGTQFPRDIGAEIYGTFGPPVGTTFV